MTNKEKIELLKKYSKFEQEGDVEKFEELCWELAETKDPKVLEDMIEILDDNCEFPEVMDNLIYAADSYDSNIYIKTVLQKTNYLISNPEWAQSIFFSIFNSREHYKIFKEEVKKNPPRNICALIMKIYEGLDDDERSLEVKQLCCKNNM